MATNQPNEQTVTRRTFLRFGALGITGSLIAAYGERACVAQANANHMQLQLNLPPYPFFANLQSVMTEDRALLDRLLVTSAYFLQCIQATGLAALAASSVGDADWARGAVRSNAMTAPYAGSYGVGLFDGAGQLPTFTTL